MPSTIVILTEDTLLAADVAHIVGLHADDLDFSDVTYRVLVPADTERNVVASILDHLGAGELRAAWDEVTGREPSPQQATATAAEQLAGSLEVLRAAGATAAGDVTSDDPLPALQTVVGEGGVREVVVVTQPHAIEDTFHQDWASRAREVLKVPVLHLYAGTSELG
jgi:hypothetical protein